MNILNSIRVSRSVQLVCIILIATASSKAHAQRKDASMIQPTFYRTIQIDGLAIFLPRGRSERRADDSPVAWSSFVVANV